MPNVFHYLAFISEFPEGLRRGSEFRVVIRSGVKKSWWLECFSFNVRFRLGCNILQTPDSEVHRYTQYLNPKEADLTYQKIQDKRQLSLIYSF